jgi:hypothetical protein
MTSIPATSWQLPNIMAMPNFNIYRRLCLVARFHGGEERNPDERYGARVRFKYFF